MASVVLLGTLDTKGPEQRDATLAAIDRALDEALELEAEALSAELAQMYDSWEHLEKLKKNSSS